MLAAVTLFVATAPRAATAVAAAGDWLTNTAPDAKVEVTTTTISGRPAVTMANGLG